MAAPTASGQEPGWLAYYARKVRRHIHWARTEGVGRLVEEDRLDPRERLQPAWRKARWRRRHGLRPGTNMLMRGVDLAPEVEVRNENDRTVFRRFSLRSDAVLAQTVRDSRHALVLVKPLCESHRVDELLDLAGVPAGRALWVFREPGARARSEVSKFGDANLRALRTIAAGEGETIWQGQRLPPQSVELVRFFFNDTATTET